MSDDIVVIDNGQTYETQETSIVAKEEADRAERWAKFAEEQANLASGQAIEAAEASDAAAQAATVTVENRDYIKNMLDNDGFRAVAADMLAEPSSIKTALENANNAAADAENAEESATIASQQAEDAQHWAEDSRVWAVGSDTEVNQLAPNQGKHSSKTYADLAGNEADRAQQEADRAKQYGNDKLNITNITNCITEIPQDIKLELNDGTLTLKAGSKVYVPNGFEADGVTPKFDIQINDSDRSLEVSSLTSVAAKPHFLYVNKGTGSFGWRPLDNAHSGTSDTGSGTTFYNTSSNIITAHNASGDAQTSFPIAIITTNSTQGITSIDQVFNGFGYIGSTVFALPGVKGLMPNGRNGDGSLKNIEFTVDKVLTRTFSANVKTVTYITSGGIYSTGQRVFDFEKNAYVENGGLIYQTELTKLTTDSNGQITLFSPKLSYRAVDYSDSSWVSAQAMPSSKYIDLTLGASGTIYIAPANGYYYLNKAASAAGQYIIMSSGAHGAVIRSHGSSDALRLMLQVRKGQNFKLDYTVAGATNQFRFIYAEGEK